MFETVFLSLNRVVCFMRFTSEYHKSVEQFNHFFYFNYLIIKFRILPFVL